jgi:hypothetical protein
MHGKARVLAYSQGVDRRVMRIERGDRLQTGWVITIGAVEDILRQTTISAVSAQPAGDLAAKCPA